MNEDTETDGICASLALFVPLAMIVGGVGTFLFLLLLK
jgi:hypothetical protein